MQSLKLEWVHLVVDHYCVCWEMFDLQIEGVHPPSLVFPALASDWGNRSTVGLYYLEAGREEAGPDLALASKKNNVSVFRQICSNFAAPCSCRGSEFCPNLPGKIVPCCCSH